MWECNEDTSAQPDLHKVGDDIVQTVMSDSKLNKKSECIQCHVEPKSFSSTGRPYSRCVGCRRKFKKAEMARLRRNKRMREVELGEVDGRKVCSRCFHSKLMSEYTQKKSKYNKVCDSCLTSIYRSKSRMSVGMCDTWWRKRSYTCNTAGRQDYARSNLVAVKFVKLSDLAYVCKPQDLVDMYIKQGGKCTYCSVTLDEHNTSTEHETPLARGGKHSLDNIKLSCRDCNWLKHTKTREEFECFIPEYISRFRITEPSDKEPKG